MTWVSEHWTVPESAKQSIPPGWDVTLPTLMCATDGGYVQPLAAALCSAANAITAEPGSSDPVLQLVLLDGGIRGSQWKQLEPMLCQLRISVIRVQADSASVQHLSTSHHISHTAYFRLLSSQWLPDWVTRVIYLDCDTLVLEDLNQLWEMTTDHQTEVWAVPDIACPFIDARLAEDSERELVPYLAAVTPVANYRELGFAGTEKYFNSGVMVLNLQRWREESRSQQLLDCLLENARYVWCWDQYALNVVFRDRWGQLPLRWNFGSHVYDYPKGEDGWHVGPCLHHQFAEMQRRPAVIHYTTEIKPWQYYCFHPLKDRYFEFLDRTPWSGWRPKRPGFSVWWHVQTFRVQKRILTGLRRMGF